MKKAKKVFVYCLYFFVCLAAVFCGVLSLQAGENTSAGSLVLTEENTSDGPLVIKVEDFGIFLFESSEEIYRANVKDPAAWSALQEKAISDTEYDLHYNWLYDTYATWDEHRRNQLKTIMTEYGASYLSQSLIQEGKQEADLNEIIKCIREKRPFRQQKELLADFYSWYGANYAVPHYEKIKPLLQKKVDTTISMVGKDFDIISFIEKETGIHRKKKQQNIELQLNMRIIGMSVFFKEKDTITTIQWNKTPEKIWTAVFNEFSGAYFDTFTGGWTFRYTSRKLKKDESLADRYKEDIPYTWDGWIEKNLTEGFAKYLIFRKGLNKDLREGTYVFDREYARALLDSFDPQKVSLKDYTINYLKKTYNI